MHLNAKVGPIIGTRYEAFSGAKCEAVMYVDPAPYCRSYSFLIRQCFFLQTYLIQTQLWQDVKNTKVVD